MKPLKNVAYQLIWVYTQDFPDRSVPLVILKNGKPGYVINQWIYWLIEEGTPLSTLERRIRSVMSLYEFYYRKYGETNLSCNEAKTLVSDYIKARQRPDKLFGYKRIATRTLQKIIYDINLFDVWNIKVHNSPRLNSSEKYFMSAWELYIDFKQRSKWDPMLHLYPSKTHVKEKFIHNIKIDHERFRYKNKTIYKSFPLEAFVDLIEKTPNPRDQMLYLLMGGASLRKSEPLHLFQSDILGIDRDGATRIKLDDPEIGEFNWKHNGQQNNGTRSEYIKECFRNEALINTNPDLYRLAPRTRLKRNYWVGYKGMTFSSDAIEELNADGRLVHNHELFWIDKRFGKRFQQAYQEYFEEYFLGKPRNWPYHPWLMITTHGSNAGMPMKLSSIRSQWNLALRRIRMSNCGLGPHSLRHMAGSYCASVLGLPIETTKVLMHHSSITSTETYYHLKSEDIRNAIIDAIKTSKTAITDYVIFPGEKCIQTPDHWNI